MFAIGYNKSDGVASSRRLVFVGRLRLERIHLSGNRPEMVSNWLRTRSQLQAEGTSSEVSKGPAGTNSSSKIHFLLFPKEYPPEYFTLFR